MTAQSESAVVVPYNGRLIQKGEDTATCLDGNTASQEKRGLNGMRRKKRSSVLFLGFFFLSPISTWIPSVEIWKASNPKVHVE